MRAEFYEKRDEKIVALRRQGLSLRAISERYGLGVSRVSKIIQLSENEVSHQERTAGRSPYADN